MRQTLLLLLEQQCHFSIRRLVMVKKCCDLRAFCCIFLEENNERIELPIEQQQHL